MLKIFRSLISRSSLLQNSGDSSHLSVGGSGGAVLLVEEHPLVGMLRDETGRLLGLAPAKREGIRLVAGESSGCPQALDAYRALCASGRYDESLAVALDRLLQAAVDYQIRVLSHFSADIGPQEREAVAASAVRYWRMALYVRATSHGRISRQMEFPGRLFSAIGLHGQSLQSWFQGDLNEYSDAWLEFVKGVYFDGLPRSQLSRIQLEAMLRFLDHHGPKLRLTAHTADPKLSFARMVEAALMSYGVGGVYVEKCHLDLLALKSFLIELTGELRTSGTPAYLDGIGENSAVLAGLLHPFLTHWTFFKRTRKGERAAVAGKVEIVEGLPDILAVVHGGSSPSMQTWELADRHDKGLSALANKIGEGCQPGCLVGVRGSGQGGWSFGIVRRLARDKDRRYAIGVELLPNAYPRRFSAMGKDGKTFESIGLYVERTIYLSFGQVGLGKLLSLREPQSISARNLRIGEVGSNFEMHLLSEE